MQGLVSADEAPCRQLVVFIAYKRTLPSLLLIFDKLLKITFLKHVILVYN